MSEERAVARILGTMRALPLLLSSRRRCRVVFIIGPPDVEGLLSDLSDTLGPWTYLLVGGLAFLETGAFVGLIAPGETAIVLGGVVAASGRSRSRGAGDRVDLRRAG